MKKTCLGLLAVFLPCVGLAQITGKPRFVRTQTRTDVFFHDLKESYWIDSDRRHNLYMDAFMKAADQKRSVQFTADPHSRQILKVQGVTDPLAPTELQPGVDAAAVEDSAPSQSQAPSGPPPSQKRAPAAGDK